VYIDKKKETKHLSLDQLNHPGGYCFLLIERNHHHYHSTPLRPQQIHSHIRHPSTSSSTCSSPTPHEQLNDKECRNTR
jgi:hypothetical protein